MSRFVHQNPDHSTHLTLTWYSSSSPTATNIETTTLDTDEKMPDFEDTSSSSSSSSVPDEDDDDDDGLDSNLDEDSDTKSHLAELVKSANKNTEKTVRRVLAFKEISKEKHPISIPIVPLKEGGNWYSWMTAIELSMRMRHVWCLVVGGLKPLDKDHKLYPWYERMVDVAVSIIYVNVAREVRKLPCFMQAIRRHKIDDIFSHLWLHYGEEQPRVESVQVPANEATVNETTVNGAPATTAPSA